jgi:hypothetical protein
MDAADAATITITLSKVSGWNDKSGRGYHFTQNTDAAARPTYSTSSQNSNSTISFNGSSYLIGNSTATAFAIGTNSYALFAVFKITSGVGGIYNKSFLGSAQGRILCVKDSSTTLNCCFTHDAASGFITSVTNNSTSYQMVSLIINKKTTNNDTLYVNGVLQGTTYTYPTGDTTNYTATSYVMLIGAYNNTTGTGPHPII